MPDSNTPQHSKYPILAVGLCMLVVIASNGLTTSGLTVFDEALLAEFGWSVGELKLRDSINFLGAALLAIAVGHWVDRTGFKAPLMFGLAALALAYFVYSYAQTLFQVYALHILFAMVLACAGNTVAMIAAASSMPERRGLAVGITLAGTSMGGILIPPLANWLNQSFGWRETMRMEALFPIVVFVLVLFLLKNRVGSKSEKSTATPAEGVSFKMAARSPQFYFLAVASTVAFYSVLALYAHLFLYMRTLEFTPQTASLAISVFSLSALGGKLVFGWLSDITNPFVLLRINMLVMLLGLAGIVYFPNLIWLFVALTAVGWGGIHTLFNATLLALYGMHSAGKIFATFSVFQSLGAGTGAAATGLLFDQRGDYSLAFGVVIGLMTFGFVMTLLVKPLNQTSSA